MEAGPGAEAGNVLIGEILRVALGALRANKMRSFLTMLGIVIGVAAVIAMIALGRGAQQAVRDRISALGTTLLTIMPGQQFGRGVAAMDSRARLTMDDAEAVAERATLITAVQPEMQRQQGGGAAGGGGGGGGGPRGGGR